jgi:hypothetical protein
MYVAEAERLDEPGMQPHLSTKTARRLAARRQNKAGGRYGWYTVSCNADESPRGESRPKQFERLHPSGNSQSVLLARANLCFRSVVKMKSNEPNVKSRRRGIDRRRLLTHLRSNNIAITNDRHSCCWQVSASPASHFRNLDVFSSPDFGPSIYASMPAHIMMPARTSEG